MWNNNSFPLRQPKNTLFLGDFRSLHFFMEFSSDKRLDATLFSLKQI